MFLLLLTSHHKGVNFTTKEGLFHLEVFRRIVDNEEYSGWKICRVGSNGRIYMLHGNFFFERISNKWTAFFCCHFIVSSLSLILYCVNLHYDFTEALNQIYEVGPGILNFLLSTYERAAEAILLFFTLNISY